MTPKLPDWVHLARNKWHYHGQGRPAFAQQPDVAQESVWDYPRPPVLVRDSRRVIVRSHGNRLADSHSSIRILETASPPTFYLPPEDVHVSDLVAIPGSSICEWKGSAYYWATKEPQGGNDHHAPVAWTYVDPYPGFESIAGYFAFYPGRVECYVNEERVAAQEGGLYGGWITNEVVGPFKGPPGTAHW